MSTGSRTAARVVVLLALGLAALLAVSQTVADVDLWGHVTFGQEILESGVVRQVDNHSFTSDVEWINHEWLFEVLMASSYLTLGPTGLILLRLSMVATLCWFVWSNARHQGTSRESAFVLVTVLALLTYTRTQHVRPQLASLVAFAALLWLVRRAGDTSRYYLVTIPPLMLLWANTHGGWLVGGGAIGLWSVAQLVFGPSRRLGLLVAASALVGLLATLINPYGFGLWTFLASTVGFGRPDIKEWSSVIHAGWGMFVVWSIAAALSLRAILFGLVPSAADRILLVALAFASFRVNRLDAFFVIAAAMLCVRGGFVIARDESPNPRVASWRIGPLLATGVVLLLCLSPQRLNCLQMERTSWPEPAVVEYVRQSQLHGRLMTYFDWGEYAIWYLAPELKVSIDGRRETVYSMRHVTGHLKAYGSLPEGKDYLAEIAPDYAWLPRDVPLVTELSAQGWSVLWSGPRSTLLSRDRRSIVRTGDDRPGDRCFPGP